MSKCPMDIMLHSCIGLHLHTMAQVYQDLLSESVILKTSVHIVWQLFARMAADRDIHELADVDGPYMLRDNVDLEEDEDATFEEPFI